MLVVATSVTFLVAFFLVARLACRTCQRLEVTATSARHRSVLNNYFRLCCFCSWLHMKLGAFVRSAQENRAPTSKIVIGLTWTPRIELWQTWFGHCLRISSHHSSIQPLFYACTLAQAALPLCQSCIGISGASGALQATTLMSSPRPLSRQGITKNANSYHMNQCRTVKLIPPLELPPVSVLHQFCSCIEDGPLQHFHVHCHDGFSLMRGRLTTDFGSPPNVQDVAREQPLHWLQMSLIWPTLANMIST